MAFVAAENRLSQGDVISCCGIEPMPLRHVGPCAMGIDVQGTTKGFHVVIGIKLNQYVVKIVKLARVKGMNELYDLVRDYNVSCVVADIEPETRLMRDFMENVSAEGFLCDYQEQMKKTIDYNTKESLVKGNRTEICDNTHGFFKKDGRLLLPRNCDEVKEYASQMTATAKVLAEDLKTGKKEYHYKKLGNDDYYHATNYFLLALARVSVCRQEEDTSKAKDAWDKDWEAAGRRRGSYMGM